MVVALFHGGCGHLWLSAFVSCQCLLLWVVIVSGHCHLPCEWSLSVVVSVGGDGRRRDMVPNKQFQQSSIPAHSGEHSGVNFRIHQNSTGMPRFLQE